MGGRKVNSMVSNYTDLEVWKKGMELAKEIYKVSSHLPKEELYGLTAQMKRAAVSVPSNIAEGHRRHHRKEFIQFLYQALGSTSELETQLLLSQELYRIQIPKETMENLGVLSRKIGRLIQFLKETVK